MESKASILEKRAKALKINFNQLKKINSISIRAKSILLTIIEPKSKNEILEALNDKTQSVGKVISWLIRIGLCTTILSGNDMKYISVITKDEIQSLKVIKNRIRSEKKEKIIINFNKETTQEFIKNYLKKFLGKKITPWDQLIYTKNGALNVKN